MIVLSIQNIVESFVGSGAISFDILKIVETNLTTVLVITIKIYQTYLLLKK
jgi:hypothetical protein